MTPTQPESERIRELENLLSKDMENMSELSSYYEKEIEDNRANI
jgi:hypothetical protein